MSGFTDEQIEAKLAAEKALKEDYGNYLSEEEDEDKDFDEWVEDDDSQPVKSLFSNQNLPSIQALIEHDREKFGFDLQQVVGQYCTDDISFIKLVNFLRSVVQTMSTADTATIIAKIEEDLQKREFLEGDTYMRPILSDDPLLYQYEDFFTNIVVEDDTTQTMPVIKSIEELNEIIKR